MTARYTDTSLGEYLKEATARPWVWGDHDCSAWPAKWAGLDLPEYDDEAGALGHIDAHVGLVGLWTHCIAGKLDRTDTPTPGDVAIIRAVSRDYDETEVGAIWTGKRWAFLTHAGLACASADPIAIWSVPCPKQ